MRKIFTALILCVFMCGICSADINPDPEIHRVIGGLYSLVSALAMNGQSAPNLRIIRTYFDDTPNDWLNTIRVERVKNDLWAGISVGKMSTARKYLRANSPELGITDKPAGDSWMSGDYAWLKAGSVEGVKLIPSSLRAAKGSGDDAGIIFFSADGNNWWQSYPSLTEKSSQEILRLWGVEAVGLHKPEGIRRSIYDEVRPSAVRKPADIHTGRKREFGESYDVNMGDVIFNPIPQTHYNDWKE